MKLRRGDVFTLHRRRERNMIIGNGGHNRPVWIRKSGATEMLPVTGNMALGVMPGLPYNERTIHLEPGDSLFLYTDGISEAMNPNDELFGDSRLMATCSALSSASAKVMIGQVEQKVRAFVDGATQHDDMTMLSLLYKGE